MSGPRDVWRAAGEGVQPAAGRQADADAVAPLTPPRAKDRTSGELPQATPSPDSRRQFNGRSQPTSGEAPCYGALDLGTNNCRLLVARPSRRGFLVVDAFSRIIRLGEGVSSSGRLSEEAMSRTIDALRVCQTKLERQKVVRSRLIATEACRIAANGSEFLERVRREVGLSLEIVDRETEAKLAVSGCASLVERDTDLALVFDIGGGSSELVWLDFSKRTASGERPATNRLEIHAAIAAWTSLPVGVVTLAERHGGRSVGAAAFEGMVEDVMDRLTAFEARHPFRPRLAHQRAHMLGTSGTVTTVAGIHLGLPRYDRNRVDGCWLHTNDVRKVTTRLLDLDYDGRVAEPCVGHERADLVLAGCAILEAMLRMWPVQRLRVADRGLREGILATLMAEDGVYRTHRRHQRGW